MRELDGFGCLLAMRVRINVSVSTYVSINITITSVIHGFSNYLFDKK